MATSSSPSTVRAQRARLTSPNWSGARSANHTAGQRSPVATPRSGADRGDRVPGPDNPPGAPGHHTSRPNDSPSSPSATARRGPRARSGRTPEAANVSTMPWTAATTFPSTAGGPVAQPGQHPPGRDVHVPRQPMRAPRGERLGDVTLSAKMRKASVSMSKRAPARSRRGASGDPAVDGVEDKRQRRQPTSKDTGTDATRESTVSAATQPTSVALVSVTQSAGTYAPYRSSSNRCARSATRSCGSTSSLGRRRWRHPRTAGASRPG